MSGIREHANELLRRIQDALPMDGEASLEWDENNQCALTFDEALGVVITLDEVMEAIFFGWVLGELPAEPAAAAKAMRELLEANHEWRMSEGGTLGLDPDTGLVTLAYRVDLPLDDAAVIQEIFAKLYNICGHWQKSLGLGYPEALTTEPANSGRDPK
ncbi:MAG TPA: CesT family type III secretion system chaperone [Candidatus Saccharimonadia bacterium]|nr:CesT family type III secretion system chaperone [Candidatus Saccharimonadia bacterium]